VYVTCVGKFINYWSLGQMILDTGRTETLGVTYLALAGMCIGIGEILGNLSPW